MTDVLVFSTVNERISWLDRSGGGTLIENTVGQLPPAFLPLRTFFVSDVNSDGHLDIVTTHHVFSTETEILTWYKNDGTGLNWIEHELSNGYALYDMKSVAMADLDGDGDEDLIMNMAFLGTGSSLFLLFEATPTGFDLVGPIGTSMDTTEPVLGDYDGDGDLDLGGLARVGNTAAWAENLSVPGNWNFGPATHPMPLSASVVASDWDGDGTADLILGTSSSVQLAVNDGLGGFAAPIPMFVNGPGTGPNINVQTLEAIDWNNDGAQDLTLRWTPDSSEPRRISYLVNEGIGSFSNRIDIRTYLPNESNLERAFADVDFDGDMDMFELVVLPITDTRLKLIRNDRTYGQGVTACPGLPNSADRLSQLSVVGSETAEVNRTTLAASQLPAGQFTLFLVGDGASTGSIPFGSQGRFCLSGTLGRFNRMGELRVASPSGHALLNLDLTDVPSPVGPVTITAGATKVFQAWHRDLDAGVSTSNFSNAVALTFQ